jgi:hypothetical protein
VRKCRTLIAPLVFSVAFVGCLQAFSDSDIAAKGGTYGHVVKTAVTPRDCGAVNDGVHDDANAIVDCARRAAEQGTVLLLDGAYGVSTLTLRASGAAPLTILSSATLIGVGPSAGHSSLIDTGGAVSLVGQLKLQCRYDPRYEAGVWVHGEGGHGAQFISIENLSFDRCALGWRIGDIAYPGAVVSEISIHGGYTYNTPIAILAEGYNTYVSFFGPSFNVSPDGWLKASSTTPWTIADNGEGEIIVEPQLKIVPGLKIEMRARLRGEAQFYQEARVVSYDSATGRLRFAALTGYGVGRRLSTWQVGPAMAGIVDRGAYVTVVGGELGMPGAIGRLISLRTSGSGTGKRPPVWGRVMQHGVNNEVPAVMADTVHDAPGPVNCAAPGGLSVFGGFGYVSQDLAPFINTSSDFCGSIVAYGSAFWAETLRKQPTISSGSNATTFDRKSGADFGHNFDVRTSTVPENAADNSSKLHLSVCDNGSQLAPGSTRRAGRVIVTTRHPGVESLCAVSFDIPFHAPPFCALTPVGAVAAFRLDRLDSEGFGIAFTSSAAKISFAYFCEGE